VITGTSTGAVIEAGGVANAVPGTPTATGDLLATDVDNTLDQFQAVAAGAATINGYGTYELSADGVWTYTLDNALAAVQALNVASTPLIDSFTVLSADGTSQLVTVTIDGTNDAAVITGTSVGTVVEAGGLANAIAGTPIATDDLLATDVDNTLDQFQAVAAGAATANGYGTYELSAAGVWTYNLDNANAAVQALDNGGFLSDSFTVVTADGTAQTVNITIQGTTDITNVSPTNITLQAADVGNGLPAANATIGTLSTTDADAGDTHAYSVPTGSIFYIDGNTLKISSGLAPGSSYSVTVTTTDSVSTPYAKTFVVITGTAQADDMPGTGNDDVLYGFNGADNLIYGDGGNDALFGQGNNDKLSGGDGNDVLNGGAGNDSLTGGNGDDVFRFTTNLSAANNVDTITDFVSGSDRIDLENTGGGLFNALPAGALSEGAFDVVGIGAAADGNTRIIYDPTTGALSYDADGTGATAAVQFAIVGVTIHPSLAYTDFVVI
jgi:VCBS repeat-containing protein